MLLDDIKNIVGNIQEEWADTVKTADGDTFEIYKNPTVKDLRRLKISGADHYRYIVDLYGKKKVIYVFNSKLLHYIAAEHLGIPYKARYHAPIWGDYGFGSSWLHDNKLDLDFAIKKEIKKMGEKAFDMEFLRQYFANI